MNIIPDIGGDGSAWFCAVAQPNCHARVERELYQLGYRTYVPQLRKWVSHARTKKAVYRPLLGRYMFVEVDPDDQGFYRIRKVNGLADIVSVRTRLGLEPVKIPTRDVEEIRFRQMKGEFDQVANEQIPIGARVRIVEGLWENHLAVLTKRHKGRLEIRLEGLATPRTVSPSMVRPAA